MNMKKWFLMMAVMGAMPLSVMAQYDDDMYFVPSKKSVENTVVKPATVERSTYYSGSSRDVDEYNRMGGSYYQALPADSASDIIDFAGGVGVYPDSLQMGDDFQLTREMSRWDGYDPGESFWAGYYAGRATRWGWHSPWYYSSFYPWYDPWYDPWYYAGWYDPWYYGGWYGPYGYYGYYGWHRPYYYGWYAPVYHGTHYAGVTGTRSHGRGHVAAAPRGISNGRTTTHSAGTFGGSRLGRSTTTRTTTTNRATTTTNSSRNSNFGGNRATTTTSPTRTSSASSSSGGSFGGSRSSGGGSFGGGGGSRSSGGGGSFGGRR